MVFPRLQFFSGEIAHRFSTVTVLGVLLNARDVLRDYSFNVTEGMEVIIRTF